MNILKKNENILYNESSIMISSLSRGGQFPFNEIFNKFDFLSGKPILYVRETKEEISKLIEATLSNKSIEIISNKEIRLHENYSLFFMTEEETLTLTEEEVGKFSVVVFESYNLEYFDDEPENEEYCLPNIKKTFEKMQNRYSKNLNETRFCFVQRGFLKEDSKSIFSYSAFGDMNQDVNFNFFVRI